MGRGAYCYYYVLVVAVVQHIRTIKLIDCESLKNEAFCRRILSPPYQERDGFQLTWGLSRSASFGQNFEAMNIIWIFVRNDPLIYELR